jgi:hypothetical protein
MSPKEALLATVNNMSETQIQALLVFLDTFQNHPADVKSVPISVPSAESPKIDPVRAGMMQTLQDRMNALDYSSPNAVIKAADSGVNVIGKTVKVTATTDVTLGYFYTKTDMSVGANVAVGVYSEDSILALDMDYTGIKKGQTVIGTIKYYDSELSSSRIILVTPDK